MTATCYSPCPPTPRSTQDSVQHQYYQVPCCRCGKTHYQQQTIVTGSIHKPAIGRCNCRRNVCTCGLVSNNSNEHAVDDINYKGNGKCSCSVPKIDVACGDQPKRNGLDYNVDGDGKVYCDCCGQYLNGHRDSYRVSISDPPRISDHPRISDPQRISDPPQLPHKYHYEEEDDAMELLHPVGPSRHSPRGSGSSKDSPNVTGHHQHQTGSAVSVQDGGSVCTCRIPTKDEQTSDQILGCNQGASSDFACRGRPECTCDNQQQVDAGDIYPPSDQPENGGSKYKDCDTCTDVTTQCKGYNCCPCDRGNGGTRTSQQSNGLSQKKQTDRSSISRPHRPNRQASNTYTDASSSTAFSCSCSPNCVNNYCFKYKSNTAVQTGQGYKSSPPKQVQDQDEVVRRRPSLTRSSRPSTTFSTDVIYCGDDLCKKANQYKRLQQKSVQVAQDQNPCPYSPLQNCHTDNFCPACYLLKHINCVSSTCEDIHKKEKKKSGWKCCKFFQNSNKEKKKK